MEALGAHYVALDLFATCSGATEACQEALCECLEALRQV